MKVPSRQPREALKLRAVQVDVEFIKEAHGAACLEWKRKLENEFPDLFWRTAIGKRYVRHGGGVYILASVGAISRQAVLVNLETGNAWSDAREVEDLFSIKKQEFINLCGGEHYAEDFTPVI